MAVRHHRPTTAFGNGHIPPYLAEFEPPIRAINRLPIYPRVSNALLTRAPGDSSHPRPPGNLSVEREHALNCVIVYLACSAGSGLRRLLEVPGDQHLDERLAGHAES